MGGAIRWGGSVLLHVNVFAIQSQFLMKSNLLAKHHIYIHKFLYIIEWRRRSTIQFAARFNMGSARVQ